MSDTPLDMGLDRRPSLRVPAFLDDRAEDFREEYNEMLEQTNLDKEARDAFTLDSASDTYRRLVDMGLYHFHENGLPFGYAFNPELLSDDDDTHLYCPACGHEEQDGFRIGASHTDDGIVFDNVTCLSCDASHDLGDVLVPAPNPLF